MDGLVMTGKMWTYYDDVTNLYYRNYNQKAETMMIFFGLINNSPQCESKLKNIPVIHVRVVITDLNLFYFWRFFKIFHGGIN